MEQRISIITLGVTNLDASRRFYERLGWTTATGNDETEIVAFNLQSFVLALYQREALSRDAGVVMSNQPTPPFTMAYNVRSKSEVDRVITSADTNGARVLELPQDRFWGGYSGYFSDLDGFVWEVAFNPYSQPAEDGSFQWNRI